MVEYQVAVVNRESETHVIRINLVDTKILLSVGHAIIAYHHCLDVSSSVTIVGDIGCYLSTVHSLTPCYPFLITGESADSLQVGIALVSSTPTVVVSTHYSILLSDISLVEHNAEVVPVVTLRGVVGEVDHLRFLRFNLDILSMSRPPARRVVLCTQHQRGGHNDRLGECRQFLHNAEGLGGNDRLRSIQSLKGLVVDGNKGFLSQSLIVRNSLKLQVSSSNVHSHTLFEGYHTNYVGKSLFLSSSYEYFAGHTRDL